MHCKDSMDEGLALILQRRTIRRFEAKKVDRNKIIGILKAALSAPSAHNLQAWRILVIDDASKKEQLADLASKLYYKSLIARNIAGATVKAGKARERIVSAPVILILFLARDELRKEASWRRIRNEWIMGTQSLAAMAQNILLAASALGLGACWRGVALFMANHINREFNIPHSMEPQALIELGYPMQKPKPKKVRDMKEVVHFNEW